mgnify:CR=1 FL=1
MWKKLTKEQKQHYKNKAIEENNNMKTIKFLKDKKIQLDGSTYKPYCIGDLPPSFGCIAHERDADGDIVKYGISEWFAFKGFCYIPE